MATLVSTSVTTSLNLSSSPVWTTANASNADADMIAGYDIRYFSSYNSFNNGVWERLQYFDNGTIGNATQLSRFYPYVINGARNADGTCGVDIRRTSVHQDGSGFGAFFGTIRYRANGSNFWEITENWGSGTYYPFMANVQTSTTDSQVAVWIRGGLGYYYRFHSAEAFTSTSIADSRSFSGSTISFTTASTLPASSHLYQHHICSQGFDLGASTFRWGTIFLVNAISASSDSRTKENIGESLGLEFLLNLEPSSYRLKSHKHMDPAIAANLDQRRYHGLLAQQVRDTLEKLDIPIENFSGVDLRNDEHYAIQYDEFVAVCVKAMQEHLNILEILESKVDKLLGTV